MVSGGSADVSSLAIEDTLQSLTLVPTYGAIFAASATVTSDALSVADTGGIGVVVADATGAHTNLVAERNVTAAVWVQDSTSLSLRVGTGR